MNRPSSQAKRPLEANPAGAQAELKTPLSPAERERLRDALHDGLGQSLTSISFLATSLRQKLAAKKMPEAAEAEEILSLTVRAISETQALVSEDVHKPGDWTARTRQKP